MAIDPLQLLSTPFPREAAMAKRKGREGTAFDALLDAAGKGEGAPGVDPRQAALELMRMEMMQSSLALSGEEGAAPASENQAVQSFLTAVANSGHRTPFPSRGGVGCGSGNNRPDQPASSVAIGTTVGEVDAKAAGIGKTAAEFLGTPYRFGGEGANGIDCSSFVQQVFRENSIALPRTAREQIRVGSDVAQGDLKKGDLVFFHTYASYPSHVGIYLGDGKMIHASSAKGEVTVSDINTPYYRSRFIGAKRVA